MIRDRNIQWARQRMYIPVYNFQGFDDAMASLADAAPAIVELDALEHACLPMAANDSVTHIMGFPSNWDITKEIGVRVCWTAVAAASATTDAATWIVLYDQVDEDELIIAPATALDTPIVALDVLGTLDDSPLKITSRGIISADKFDEAALDGLFSFNVELDAVTTFSADEPVLLGIAFDYYPMLTVGPINTDRDDRVN